MKNFREMLKMKSAKKINEDVLEPKKKSKRAVKKAQIAGKVSEKSVKLEILEAIGSRNDMMVEQRNVGFDALKGIKYGMEGEADIRVLWKREFRMLFQNQSSAFHHYEKVYNKIVGQALAIEVKRPGTKDQRGGKQSPEQKRWQAAWEAMGGIYILTDSVQDLYDQLNVVDLQDRFILA